MEDGVDPQSVYQQIEPELDIPPLQTEGVQFEALSLSKIFFQLTFTEGPSTKSSYTEPFLWTCIP